MGVKSEPRSIYNNKQLTLSSLGLPVLELSAAQTISGKISKHSIMVVNKFMSENIEKYSLTCGQEYKIVIRMVTLQLMCCFLPLLDWFRKTSNHG